MDDRPFQFRQNDVNDIKMNAGHEPITSNHAQTSTYPNVWHDRNDVSLLQDDSDVIESEVIIESDVTSHFTQSSSSAIETESWKKKCYPPRVAPSRGTSETYIPSDKQTYMGLSVVVSVCFNLPIGLLAFFVAHKSSQSFKAGNISQGHSRACCSLVINMLGIVVTVGTVMAVVFFIAESHRRDQYKYG